MIKEDKMPPSRVLILVWGGIGNMVMALPMINAVGRELAGSTITVLAQKGVMLSLLGEDRRFAGMAMDDPRYQGLPGKLSLVKIIRHQEPEIFITAAPAPSHRSGLLAFLSGAGIRICENKYANALFNVRSAGSNGRSIINRNMALLKPLGIDAKAPEFGIRPPAQEQARAGDFLDKNNIFRDKTVIGVHPGSGMALRRWPEERFIAAGKELAAQGHPLIIFGGPEEAGLAGRVARGIGPGACRYLSDKNFGTTLALIKNCGLFISNDSGLAHCASALGVPTVVIFGPVDPEVYGHRAANVRIIKKPTDCGPCYDPARGLRCKWAVQRCLDIPVITVLEAVREMASPVR
jgi:ADP-heptose:LPS heptosyltransferase